MLSKNRLYRTKPVDSGIFVSTRCTSAFKANDYSIIETPRGSGFINQIYELKSYSMVVIVNTVNHNQFTKTFY